MVWCLCSLYVLCFSDNTKNTLLFEYQESTNWGHYFYVSNWRRDRHFTWSSESHEGLASSVQMAYFHFSVILRPLGLVRPRETNPRPPALRAVKRFTNWAGDNTELPHIVTLPKRGPFGTSYSEETPCSSILVNLNLL